MELSKSGQSTAFQSSITPPQIQSSESQFPIFTPTNWALLQNRPNIPNPNSVPIRPFAASRILMPWESAVQQSPHQHQLRSDKLGNPQIAPQINRRTENSPKSGTPKGFSKQISNKRPIQQIESAQKSQSNQVIESVRSKLRENLASALSVPIGEKNTGDENQTLQDDKQATNNLNISENKINQELGSNDSASIVDELLQGNGLCWAADSILLSQNTPQTKNPKNPAETPKTLALKIESELFRLFGGVNKKYKEKGRSLLFNLKDPSNPKLRERVLTNEISPIKLCAMSAEELASKELSEWRQAKAEEMAQAIVLPDESSMENRKRVKKTHKGEFVVIEEEKDGNYPLEAEIRAGTGVTARLVGKNEGKSEGEGTGGSARLVGKNEENEGDLMLELMGEGFRELEHLSPVVSLDEFMKDLDTEPPFENIVKDEEKSEKNEKKDEKKSEKNEKLEASSEKIIKIEKNEKKNEEINEKNESDDVAIWEGVVQLNLSALASVAAFYKSGEKPSMKDWPGFIEIKGRVRLDPFEKFLKDLPLSRSRAIMLTQIKWKEGSMESGRQNILETIESYISDARVGLAEPGPGVELYLCPSSEKMLDLFNKLLPKDLSANIHPSKDSLIGVIVWRRPVLTTVSPKNPSQNPKLQSNVKKENVSFRSPSFSARKNDALKTVRTDKNENNEDDDVPPGFGHMVGKVKDDDDLPEFHFGNSSKNVNISQGGPKPVQKMRDLINKYGHGSSSSSSSWKNLSVETKVWNNNNDDDDDIPEWNPNPDQRKPGNQIPILQTEQNSQNYYTNNNAQFIAPSQQMLQPPVVQPNFRAAQVGNINMQPNYQVGSNNYHVNSNNYQVNNNNNQWWGQGTGSAQQQTQFGYRMPNLGNQNWRPEFQGNRGA